jgi:hypothetical protein
MQPWPFHPRLDYTVAPSPSPRESALLTGEDVPDADARTDLALNGRALNPQLPSATIMLIPNTLPGPPIHIPVQKSGGLRLRS